MVAQGVMNGTWQSSNDVGDISSGYASLAPYGPLVSEDTKALVDQTKASLTSGDVQVWRGPIYDNTGQVRVPAGQVGNPDDLLQNTDWLVQGASGQIS